MARQTDTKATRPVAADALTLGVVEAALGEPAAAWKGRCYEIASRIVKAQLVVGTAVYGHWLGPVHKKSMFYKGSTLAFVQHGWIVLGDKRVLDPTRWAFEVKKPYLFLGSPGQLYDEGGNRLRKALSGAVPAFDPGERTFELTPAILPGPAWTWVEEHLDLDYTRDDGAAPGVLGLAQVMHLANMPLDELGEHAAAIYTALGKLKLTGLIPIDNYRRVQEGRWP